MICGGRRFAIRGREKNFGCRHETRQPLDNLAATMGEADPGEPSRHGFFSWSCVESTARRDQPPAPRRTAALNMGRAGAQ